MAQGDASRLDDFNRVLSLTLFSLTSIMILALFLRVRCQIDLPAIFISVAYLVSILLRTPIVPNTDLNLLHATASMIIWGVLYFFTFEMRHLEDKLKSDTFEDNLRKSRVTRRIELLVYSAFLLIIVSSAFGLYLTKMINMQAYRDNQRFFDAVLVVRGISKIVIDSCMFLIFARSFNYFIKKKQLALVRRYGRGTEFSITNHFIITWTQILFGLTILSSFLVAVVWSLFQSSLV